MNMTDTHRQTLRCSLSVLALILLVSVRAMPSTDSSELAPGSHDLIKPEQLAKVFQSSSAAKPTVLNVGPHVIYVQAHIPGAVYVGPTATQERIEALRARTASLPRDAEIVIYCGCCPWDHCPNIRPAYQELKQMGFTKLKVLYIKNSFGSDWVDKGYPTAKGE